MDRINIKCLIDGREIELQLDKKSMPGEAGPCFMISEAGYFKGYIALKHNACKAIGASYYTESDLQVISESLRTIADVRRS